MKLPPLLFAATILLSVSPLQAQLAVVADDFESGVFDPDWDVVTGTVLAGGGAESTANFVTLGTSSGPLGSVFEGGSSDFVIDFFLRVQDSTDRLFNLQVSTASGAPGVGTATINLKYDTTDGWAAFSGGWNPLAGLPALTASEWYRARVTGTDWGSVGASFDVELSDMGGNTFTSASTGNAFYQNGDPTTAAAGSFNFNTNFGSNPGFDLDQVTVTSTPVVGDDPNLILSPASNPFAGQTIISGSGGVVAEIVASNVTGLNTLTISNASQITGDDATEFSLLTALPLDILPGESAPLQIQFANPGGSGEFSATLEIASNDSGDPLTTVSLLAEVTSVGTNLLTNGDFEADPVEPIGWTETGDGAQISEGIPPGSTSSATIAAGAMLSQDVVGTAEWYLDFTFQAPDTSDRAFNVLVFGSAGNINLRYQGTSDGADNTWNAFDNALADDSWGSALALPAIQPGATYFMRIVGRGWDGGTPVYDLHLSEPNSLALSSSVTDLNRFQNRAPSAAPSIVRFSAASGNSPGYVIDDVRFINGSAPPITPLAIVGFEHDEDADTSTIRWSAIPGQTYFIYGSSDLLNWEEVADKVATTAEESYTETGVTSSRRYYIVTTEAR